VQEKATLNFFTKNSDTYKKNASGLSKVEAIYFPSIALLIGLSNILTIAIGSYYATTHQHNITAGTITEFVMYVNMLTFPVSAIGWTAGMIQRASASQKRINEFLLTAPTIKNGKNLFAVKQIEGDIVFDKVEFVYPHTGIRALHQFN
jgi:ATP-binding cassette subfamily B protein